ncbi:hypothetical protein A0H81_01677 [Grifola frondosa]|uniref:Nephrocystin 3-like N-terminal domain-containing protein n=1 Tax=Grifola frondosa TaxID=5627 RepID=A0A1C7MMF6_GRIFR|nr:hypothetical protein A0H81_01677 [Grifola frondosa]
MVHVRHRDCSFFVHGHETLFSRRALLSMAQAIFTETVPRHVLSPFWFLLNTRSLEISCTLQLSTYSSRGSPLVLTSPSKADHLRLAQWARKWHAKSPASLCIVRIQTNYQTMHQYIGTWRQWQSTIQVVATKFTIHVMERRRLRFDRRVGSVTVITADFATSEAGCMCEKIFTLETSDKTYSIAAALSFSGLRAIDSNSFPTTPLSLQSPVLLTPATLSPDVAVFIRTEVSKTTDQVNSVTVMTSETAVDYADDLSTTISSLSQAIDFMDRVVTLVTLFEELYPITKVALEVLLDIYELVKVQTERDATIKELAMSMRELLSSLAAIKDLDKDSSLQNTVKSVMEKLIECAGFISAYTQHGFWGRFVHQTSTSQTVVSAQDFQKSFDAFQNKLDSGIGMEALEIAGVEERPLSVDEIAPLGRLPRAENVHYDGNMKCLDGTRRAIIRTLLHWIAQRESGRNIFWLHGIAGSGKSTIASTVAAMAELEDGALWQLRLGCLGGTFFCRRDDEKLHRPELIWPTIAHRLAHSYPPLRRHILSALRLNPDIGKSSIANQFRKLIAEPLSSLVSVERPLFSSSLTLLTNAAITPVENRCCVAWLNKPPTFLRG